MLTPKSLAEYSTRTDHIEDLQRETIEKYVHSYKYLYKANLIFQDSEDLTENFDIEKIYELNFVGEYLRTDHTVYKTKEGYGLHVSVPKIERYYEFEDMDYVLSIINEHGEGYIEKEGDELIIEGDQELLALLTL
jgi:hypothetical protein